MPMWMVGLGKLFQGIIGAIFFVENYAGIMGSKLLENSNELQFYYLLCA